MLNFGDFSKKNTIRTRFLNQMCCKISLCRTVQVHFIVDSTVDKKPMRCEKESRFYIICSLIDQVSVENLLLKYDYMCAVL